MTAYEVRISDWSSVVCSSDLNCTARGNRHAILPFRAPPPGVSKNPDGRSPGSRVSAPLRLPGPESGQWLAGCRSPLTVAGAATVSVPIGYASPCSHFIRRVVRLGETIRAPAYATLRRRRNTSCDGRCTIRDADVLVLPVRHHDVAHHRVVLERVHRHVLAVAGGLQAAVRPQIGRAPGRG